MHGSISGPASHPGGPLLDSHLHVPIIVTTLMYRSPPGWEYVHRSPVLGGWVTKAERDHAELYYAAPYRRRSLERPLTRQSVSQDHNHMALRKGTAAPCPLCV